MLNLLNMKLKNFLCLILLVILGAFLVIYYVTQITVRNRRLKKTHNYLGVSIDDVYIEDVIDPAKVRQENLLFEPGHYEKIMNLSSGDLHIPQRSELAQKLLHGIPASASIFSTNRMPENRRLWPTVGNGHIATVVDSDTVYMNGLYNGYMSQSHRARIPSVAAIKITPMGPFTSVHTSYSLDVGQGIFNETITSSYFEIEKLVYAHRRIKELLVVELNIHRWDLGTPLTVLLKCNHGPVSDDITFTSSDSGIAETVKLDGVIKQAETNSSKLTSVHIIHTKIPENITLSDSISMWTSIFVMSISHSPQIALSSYDLGVHYIKLNSLLPLHIAAWSELWHSGRIDVTGDLSLARMNYAALYYIMSSLPLQTDSDWPFIGLSPCGLANGGRNQDYWGHVLWDQETWMYPSIVLLHQNLSEVILSTRLTSLSSARQYATSTGYKGARFPWERAFTGTEVSQSADCARYEQHITGDIAIAFQQYLYLSNNTNFLLKHDGVQLILEIAEFWASRARLNSKTKLYEINGVMPPDERHFPVNNSAYTNAVAVQSLLLATYVLNLVGHKVPKEFTTIANNMYIPYDSFKDYHPEFDGYKIGTAIKQADVVLLGWPVQMEMSARARQNDLIIYGKVLEKDGPAMTWQAFSIGWSEVRNVQKAEETFVRWKDYSKGPFKVWTETASGDGCVNFLTGMGGYLESVIYGYLGFRIHRDKLQVNPIMPKNTTSIRVTGVDYLGSSLDFTVTEKNIRTVLTHATRQSKQLFVSVYGHFEKHLLKLKEPLVVARQLISISAA